VPTLPIPNNTELTLKEIDPNANASSPLSNSGMPSRDYILKVACLCGAKEIAEFLMRDLKIEYSSQRYEYILGYASFLHEHSEVSQNWAIEIAKKIAGTIDSNEVHAEKYMKKVNLLATKTSFIDDLEAILTAQRPNEQILPNAKDMPQGSNQQDGKSRSPGRGHGKSK
jgi:hypothetical protein